MPIADRLFGLLRALLTSFPESFQVPAVGAAVAAHEWQQ